VAARAVTQALLPGWDVDDAAGSLERLAGGNRLVMEVALARVRRNLADRPSAAAERAAQALTRALGAVPLAS
jgi:hypothetical protein